MPRLAFHDVASMSAVSPNLSTIRVYKTENEFGGWNQRSRSFQQLCSKTRNYYYDNIMHQVLKIGGDGRNDIFEYAISLNEFRRLMDCNGGPIGRKSRAEWEDEEHLIAPWELWNEEEFLYM